jgi:hypothetical protein
MKYRNAQNIALVLTVVCLFAASSVCTFAQSAARAPLPQGSMPERFGGVMNAYSPQTATGPYEIRGPWSLKLKRNFTKADFSAALNMELSDGWVLTLNGGNFDPNARGAHTHHITLVDADVTPLANGFQVSGTATITVNGNPAPVSPTPLVIAITGGSIVQFSNITLTFGLPASGHFGTAPLSGVVRRVSK